MTSYLIKYQTRREKGETNTTQGEWQDKEMVVVVDNDARDAIEVVMDTVKNCNFRLKEIKICGQVDAIMRRLC